MTCNRTYLNQQHHVLRRNPRRYTVRQCGKMDTWQWLQTDYIHHVFCSNNMQIAHKQMSVTQRKNLSLSGTACIQRWEWPQTDKWVTRCHCRRHTQTSGTNRKPVNCPFIEASCIFWSQICTQTYAYGLCSNMKPL